MNIRPEPCGAVFTGKLDGVETGADLRWRKPNNMELDIKIPGRGLRMHIYCVPVDAKRTRMILGVARTFLSDKNPLAWLSNQFNKRVLVEDRAVVESSQPPEAPPPGDELSVATDGPTLYFRRYYYRELRNSSSTLVPASRLGARAREAATSAEVGLPTEEGLIAATAEGAS